MNYQEALEKLFNLNLFHKKKGLNNVILLDKVLNSPHRNFPIIHVAGTNGKGSVSTMIAKSLELAGYKTGLFTSPHLISFCERITVNSALIDEDSVANILTDLFTICEQEQLKPTFFELVTYLAFSYFAAENVDVAVVEVGLGGRLDATNLVHPILTIITSISLDHTEQLGETISEITAEKAGIIKPQAHVVIGPTVPKNIVMKHLNDNTFEQVEGNFTDFREENRLIAAACLKFLQTKFDIPDLALKAGLTSSAPYRLQVVKKHPLVIVDVAHNPAALNKLFEIIRKTYPEHKIKLFFAFGQSKDVTSCLEIVKLHGDIFYPLPTKFYKLVEIEKILAHFKDFNKPVNVFPSVADSLAHALQKTTYEKELILCCGSFYIVDSFVAALETQCKNF